MRQGDLITYCGAYAGSCARWFGYTEFRDLVAVLTEWVDAQGYQYWLPHETQEFDYSEFRKGLEFFSREDNWLVCHRCCKGGDGNPDCEIRKCCRERELELCFDCDEFPCAKTGEDLAMVEQARQYEILDTPEWLRLQIERADRGFEIHTKKYYQINVTEKPPTSRISPNQRIEPTA